MLLDKFNLFFDQKSLASAAGDILSDVIDLWGGNANGGLDNNGNTMVRDLANAREIELSIQLTEGIVSAGTATVTFALLGGANGDALTGGNIATPTTLWTGAALTEDTTAVIGATQRVPAVSTQGYRYVQLKATIAVATTTAGKATAGIVARRGIASPPTP